MLGGSGRGRRGAGGDARCGRWVAEAAAAATLCVTARRAEQGRQQKEAELLQAKALLEYEVQEMKSLKDFMSQVRPVAPWPHGCCCSAASGAAARRVN